MIDLAPQTAITEQAGMRPEAAAVLSPDDSLTPKVPAAIVGLPGDLEARR